MRARGNLLIHFFSLPALNVYTISRMILAVPCTEHYLTGQLPLPGYYIVATIDDPCLLCISAQHKSYLAACHSFQSTLPSVVEIIESERQEAA